MTFSDRRFTLAPYRTAIREGRSAVEVERIVADLQARADAERAEFVRHVAALGGRVQHVFWLIDACTVDVPTERVPALRSFPGVSTVAADRWLAPLIRTSTNAANHASDSVQAAGNRGTGFAIALIDTGQDASVGGSGRPHRLYYRRADVADRTGGGIGGSLLLANLSLTGSSPEDTLEHGTLVTAVAAGAGWRSAAADEGHAGDAFKVGYSFCAPTGCMGSTALQALGWQRIALDKIRYNIVVGNLSFQSSPSISDISQIALDAVVLNSDVVACCSAGNSGVGGATDSPAALNGIAVGAVLANTKRVAAFSTVGPIPVGGSRTYPDLVANGVNIVVPRTDNEIADSVVSGTSLAAPQVAGVVLLVKHAAPTLDAREIKAVLLASSEDVAGYTENSGGQGYLRADRAVACAASGDSTLTATVNTTTTPNDHVLAVTAGQTVKVALTWFRHNPTPNYSNLALTVLSGATTVVAKDSPANLYEVVTFTAPITGNLIVRVQANSLDVTPQPYALAACASTGAQPTFQGSTSGRFEISGGGCAGSGGIPSFHCGRRPAIGSPFTMNLSYAVPSTSALLLLGATSARLDLTALGAPRCIVYTTLDLGVVFSVDARGTAQTTVGIPTSTALVGGALIAQCAVADAAANGLGVVVSNAARITIGNR